MICQTKISMISFEEFKSLDIPSDVGIFYYEIKRKFQLTHEEAYRRTLEYAKKHGYVAGPVGLPGHYGPYRLLTKKEIWF